MLPDMFVDGRAGRRIGQLPHCRHIRYLGKPDAARIRKLLRPPQPAWRPPPPSCPGLWAPILLQVARSHLTCLPMGRVAAHALHQPVHVRFDRFLVLMFLSEPRAVSVPLHDRPAKRLVPRSARSESWFAIWHLLSLPRPFPKGLRRRVSCHSPDFTSRLSTESTFAASFALSSLPSIGSASGRRHYLRFRLAEIRAIARPT